MSLSIFKEKLSKSFVGVSKVKTDENMKFNEKNKNVLETYGHSPRDIFLGRGTLLGRSFRLFLKFFF